jgi:hypothetical protein
VSEYETSTTIAENTVMVSSNTMTIKVDGSIVASKIEDLFLAWESQPMELAKLLHTFYLDAFEAGLNKAGVHTTGWKAEDKKGG